VFDFGVLARPADPGVNEGLSDGERKFHAVHFPVVLEVGLLGDWGEQGLRDGEDAQEQAGLRVEVESL
jgi:hypothetical protein